MPVVRVCADHLGEKERLGSLSKQGLLTILVFGASGDLAKKKTFPALYKLYLDGLLPKYINIVGYGRSSISREDFHSSIISKISPAFYNETAIQKFQSRCTYISGAYDSDEDFISLHSQLESLEQESLDIIKKSTTPYEEFVLCQEMISADDINNLTIRNSNRIIYMAVPPNQFVHIASMTSKHLRITPKSEHNLRASLRSPTYIVDSENNEIKSGMIRIIVEKPFGSDYQTAMKLQNSLAQLFHEEEIYRIDHYLGKEMVQSLLALRFANSSFAAAWDSKSIESVKITFKETVDTAGRAGYFDKFGITRDVMQNHLLQVLALIAMECPLSNSADDVRDAKLEVLKRLSVWDQEPTEDIAEAQIPMSPEYLVTGQYSGYLEEEGVAEGSKTETFSSAVFKIQNQRWQNVPFILKCAKGVEDSRVEIRVQFKVPQNNLFSKDTLVRNELVFRVQPDEAVYLKVLTKKPGLEGSLSSLEQTELDFTLKKRFKKEEKKEKILDESNSIILPDAYEKLIWDVTRNDPSLFVRADELQQAWIVFEPILQAFKQPQYQPTQYVKGKRGPIEADQLAKKVGFEFNDSYNWVERK